MRKILAVIVFALCASSVWAAPQTFIIVQSTATYGDYSSLETAINAKEGNLTGALGGSITFRIEGAWTSSDSLRVTFHNYTTVGSSGILVQAVGDARTNGVFSQSRYRLCPSGEGASTIYISQENLVLTIDGIQIGLNSNGNYRRAFDCDGHYGTFKIMNCYIYGHDVRNNENAGIWMYASGTQYIYNNIITGFMKSASVGIITKWGENTSHVYNNTVTTCTVGIQCTNATNISKNNLCYGNNADYSGTFSSQSTNNLSKDGTAPAYNTYYTTATVAFQSGTYLIDSTDTGAKDKGADLSSIFTTSINRLTRPQGTAYDIGASEVSQEAPPQPSALVPFLPQGMIWEN